MKRTSILSFLLPMAAAFEDGKAQRARAPEPTAAPNPLQVGAMLQKRLVGSDTCGWVDAITLDSVTCNPGYQCAYNSDNFAFGCCSGLVATCILPTTCLDSTRAATLTSLNSYTFACIDPAAPRCNTYVYPGGYSGYGCDITATTAYVSLTLAGGQSAGGITTAISSPATVTAVTVTAAGVGAAQTSPSQSPASSGGSGGGGGLSTGAIVGIAIAGAVVLITAIGVIGFVCYKRNKDKRPTVVAQQQPMYQPGFPPGPTKEVFVSNPSSPNPQGPHTSYMSSGSQSVSASGAGTGSQIGSGVSQPMTQANMNAMLAGQQQQPGEWAYMQKPVAQTQSAAAAAEHDGIGVTEIMPEEAVDEPKQTQFQQTQFQQHPQQTGSPVQFAQHPGTPGPIQHPGSPGPMSSPGSPTLVHSTGSPAPPQFHPGTTPSQFAQHSPPEDVMSSMAPTAVAPTAIGHHFQNV